MSQAEATKVVTLEQIEAAHNDVAKLIECFKSQAPKQFSVPALNIEIKAGERYAGMVLKPDGTPSHHLILLPGQSIDVNWNDAKEWAEKIGGELPTRQEQSLLFANLKAEFLERYHWSCEAYSTSSAWSQTFNGGLQSNVIHSDELCARAVRRVNA